jgi:hypothetical protein
MPFSSLNVKGMSGGSGSDVSGLQKVTVTYSGVTIYNTLITYYVYLWMSGPDVSVGGLKVVYYY